jgi:hypothetical protein
VGTGVSVADGVCAGIEPVGTGGPVAASGVVVPVAHAASSTPHPIIAAVIASRRIHASSSSVFHVYVATDERTMRPSSCPGISHRILMERCHTGRRRC